MPAALGSRRAADAALAASLAIAAATGIALLIHGGSSDPSSTDYLDTIRTPSWQPPDAVFGPVWSVLYLTIAASFVASMRLAAERRWLVLRAFVANIALNAAWTPLFFGLESPWLAAVEIVLLFASCCWLVRVAWSVQPWCGWLLVPYTAWVGFATVLNWTIALLNT